MTPDSAGTRPSVATTERKALCALFSDRGALAPTLCSGWATSDLAAHLYVREHQPWAAIGIVVPALSNIPEQAMEKAKRSLGYDGLIAQIAAGPSVLFRPLDSQVNVAEYFIHHEDVRRAGSDPLPPRDDARLDRALWTLLRRGGRLLARKLRGAGLELVAPGFGSVTARRGDPLATMTGGPQELMLYLSGRSAVANVELSGSEAARRAVEDASFGL